MKRVRKYTYLPQEEIEVIETKSGQTIKSKEILDGNYVKAKPAPKKVVKKAVKKVVRKKYAYGGMITIVSEREIFNKLKEAGYTEDEIEENFDSLASDNGFKYDSDENSWVLRRNITAFSKYQMKEILSKAGYSDEEIENDLDVLADKNGYEYDSEARQWYKEEMAKGGKVGVKEYKIYPMKPTGVKGMITDDYDNMETFVGTEDEAVARAKEIANSNPNFVRVEVKLRLKTKTNTVGIVDGQNKQYAKGGKLVGKQKNLDVNKNGKLDAEDFKMLRAKKMADGGEVDRERMYNFLKDDLVALEMAIFMDEQVAGREEKYKEEIDKFFSYWNTHLKSLKRPDDAVGSNRMWNFLKDDLIALEAATKELPSSKQEIERFFSYWNTHLKSLSDEDLMNLAKGDKTKKLYKYAKGGYMAKGGSIVKDWELKSNGRYYATFFLSKDDPRYRLITEHGVTESIEDVNGGYELTISVTKEGKDFFENYEGLDANGNTYDFKNMAKGFKGGKTPIVRTQFEEEEFEYAKGGEILVKSPRFPYTEGYFKTMKEANEFILRQSKYRNVNGWNIEEVKKSSNKHKMMADGGKVTDKEVADSNVEMLHSNIKSIKHHAEELEQAIKDNTEVEGWVLAKADRAATAMSDITHYLDGRKMGTGGMVAGHHYKDKAGNDLRYIGPDSKNDNMGVFKNGEKYLTKSFNDFEEEKEKKSFWFGNGGFMPSGFSRKVSLSEKAEEMVGKNTWHILDAAEKGEVIGELISDGALAVTMDRGGIVDADDWAKSMTKDKIYALKKAGYSENIASEMSLLLYEQLPMWVRQDFKKGSIVIGAYHIHKNDNIPVDGKVLVLNGDEEVVYSAETLDQAQEWAINQMQEVEDEDDGNYIYVSDCCGAEAGSALDIGICPMCGEHCEWEKQSAYADGGVTEVTKFKVVYKPRDAAEPKEKLFDNAENAEFFLETIKEDDDIMSANLVEVKPMKKAAEKKAPTNLFAAAKPAAASSASKKTKEDVLVPGIADRIARYDALKAIIKNAEAEKEVIGGSLKEVGKEKFLELYELRRRNPETFNLADEDEKIMFIVMDKYIKVEPEKAGMLENYPGLLETTTTYKFNPALLDKTGEIVSRLILESTELSDDEKANLIVAETKIGIKSGSIDRLMDYDNPSQIFDLIEPILALK